MLWAEVALPIARSKAASLQTDREATESASLSPANRIGPSVPPVQVGDAIAAYLRAADTSKYNEVIAKANEVRGWLLRDQPPCHQRLSGPSSYVQRLPSKATAHSLVHGASCTPSPAQAGQHDDLAKYLLMVRKKVKDPKVRRQRGTRELVAGSCFDLRPQCWACCWLAHLCRSTHPTPPHPHPACVAPQVDTELVYAYAKNKDLGPLEEFITGTHLANLQAVGDRCAGRRQRHKMKEAAAGGCVGVP